MEAVNIELEFSARPRCLWPGPNCLTIVVSEVQIVTPGHPGLTGPNSENIRLDYDHPGYGSLFTLIMSAWASKSGQMRFRGGFNHDHQFQIVDAYFCQ